LERQNITYDLALAPDGRKLASSAGVPNSEIWVDDLSRGVRMRLTFDPERDKGITVWSPDGTQMLFGTLRGSKAGVGIFQKASNGTGDDELLLPSDRPDREAWATDWLWLLLTPVPPSSILNVCRHRQGFRWVPHRNP
jgi:Tol biopolymer transport system component